MAASASAMAMAAAQVSSPLCCEKWHPKLPSSPLGSASGQSRLSLSSARATALLSAAPMFPQARRATPSGFGIGYGSSTFLEGEFGNLSRFLIAPANLRKEKRTGPRAATDDVPSYKGFPPMLKKPRWWWRVLACIPYMMPLSETWMYAETAYSLHSFLEDYEFCTYSFLTFIGSLPGWFLLAYFFGAYLGIVRNNRWPHFFRFHVVTGMLLEIIVQVVGTVNDWVPPSMYWGKLGAHYWLAISFAFFFIVIECIRCALNGMYADVPFLSDASYMQIPFDT